MNYRGAAGCDRDKGLTFNICKGEGCVGGGT